MLKNYIFDKTTVLTNPKDSGLLKKTFGARAPEATPSLRPCSPLKRTPSSLCALSVLLACCLKLRLHHSDHARGKAPSAIYHLARIHTCRQSSDQRDFQNRLVANRLPKSVIMSQRRQPPINKRAFPVTSRNEPIIRQDSLSHPKETTRSAVISI